MDHYRRQCALLASISYTMIVNGCTAPPANHFDDQVKQTGIERNERADLPSSSNRGRADAIAKQLSDPALRGIAKRELIQMGPIAEPAVLPFLKNPEWDVRLSACKILAAIGTQQSIPALQDLSGAEHNSLVNTYADRAVDAIRSRMK